MDHLFRKTQRTIVPYSRRSFSGHRDAIDIYTNERPHRSVDMMTPAEAYKKTVPIKKRWWANSRRRKSTEKRRKCQHNLITEFIELF